MNQSDLRQMANERLLDAQVLLNGSRWEFAYYASGYAVECGLKSCILSRMILTGWVFEEKWDAKQCRDHDINNLVKLAGLGDELNSELKASASAGGEFARNWATALNWTVSSRYQPRTEAEARQLFAAIADDPHGVMQWIRRYW